MTAEPAQHAVSGGHGAPLASTVGAVWMTLRSRATAPQCKLRARMGPPSTHGRLLFPPHSSRTSRSRPGPNARHSAVPCVASSWNLDSGTSCSTAGAPRPVTMQRDSEGESGMERTGTGAGFKTLSPDSWRGLPPLTGRSPVG